VLASHPVLWSRIGEQPLCNLSKPLWTRSGSDGRRSTGYSSRVETGASGMVLDRLWTERNGRRDHRRVDDLNDLAAVYSL
jgi:hypothetical protein